MERVMNIGKDEASTSIRNFKYIGNILYNVFI